MRPLVVRRYKCLKFASADASAKDYRASVAIHRGVEELVAAHQSGPEGCMGRRRTELLQGPAPPEGVVRLASQGGVMQGPAPPEVGVWLVE